MTLRPKYDRPETQLSCQSHSFRPTACFVRFSAALLSFSITWLSAADRELTGGLSDRLVRGHCLSQHRMYEQRTAVTMKSKVLECCSISCCLSVCCTLNFPSRLWVRYLRCVNRVCLAYCVKCNSTLSAKHGTQNLSLSVCVDKRREPVIEQALKYFIF